MRVNIKIKTKEDIINILNQTKEIVIACNKDKSLYEFYLGYENFCEEVEINILCEIESALIGGEKMSPHTLANADMRVYDYWQYLDNKISLKTMFKRLKEHSDKTLIEI
jgi:hypothetical protein